MGSLVLEAVLSSVLATVGCLVTAPRRSSGRARRGAASPLVVRMLFPLLPLLPLAGVVALLDGVARAAVLTALLWLSTLPWLHLTRRWSAWAHAGWSLTVSAGGAYMAAMVWWTVDSGLSGVTLVGAWVLLLLEAASFVMLLSYGWEIFDVLGTRRWLRRLAPGTTAVVSTRADLPFVSIHVPAHNEPPDLLVETLRSLAQLDYPAYEVLVIDNNTEDDALVEPVAAFCAEHPDVFRFHRLLDWPGYKSGALNYALTVTSPDALLVGVVDADYQVDPDWLLQTVGAFDDPQVAFVQSPQDYRDWEGSSYLRRLYFSYDYFFAVSQPSRDERDAAIFGGTMGLVRLKALERVGGWDEWCVTEDAELSLRLLAAGYRGHHVDRPFGRGIMPLTFEALKGQRFRWCFGGMQILRRHWRTLMPWTRTTPMSRGQRLAYLVGGVQWMGDLLSLVFAAVVALSLVDLALGGGLVAQRLSGLLLVAVPALLLFGLVRAVTVVKLVAHRATWRDAIGAFLMWLSLGWVVSLAVVRGLTEPAGVFLRTPKVKGEVHLSDAVRSNRAELASCLVAVAAILAALMVRPSVAALGLSALLLVPVVGWLAAPANTLAAFRADLPDRLRARRDSETQRARWSRSVAVRTSFATAAAAVVVAAVVALVVSPSSTQAPRTTAVPVLDEATPAVPDPTSSGVTTWEAPAPAGGADPTGDASQEPAGGPSSTSTTTTSAASTTTTSAAAPSATTSTEPPAPTTTTSSPTTTADRPTQAQGTPGKPTKTKTPRPPNPR